MPPKEGSDLDLHKSNSSDNLDKENDIAYSLEQMNYNASAEPLKSSWTFRMSESSPNQLNHQ